MRLIEQMHQNNAYDTPVLIPFNRMNTENCCLVGNDGIIGEGDRHGVAAIEKARGLFGSSVTLLRMLGSVIAGIKETARQRGADLVVVGPMRPGAPSFGRQSHILKIDHAVHCPVLSVW